MKQKTSVKQSQPAESTVANDQSRVTTHKRHLPYVMYFVMLVVLSIVSYAFVVNQGILPRKVAQIVPTNSQQSLPTVQPTITSSDINTLGETTVSFADSGAETYLKHTINLSVGKALIPNSNVRSSTTIFTQNVLYVPQEAQKVDSNNLHWIELVKQPISDIANSSKVLVWDRLLSFKLVPSSKSILFSEEFHKSGDKTEDSERTLYFYDRSSGAGTVRVVHAFTREKDGYSFPMIHSISPDGRYANIELFGCWNCGGHEPKTLLLDLQSLKSINIGKVIQFAWGNYGKYTYKDYVEIDCTDERPGPCNPDPNTLESKSGQVAF